MKIVCASSVLYGEEAFSTIGEVVLVPEKDITQKTVREADMVISRSKLKLDGALLAGSSVRFVATATAGFDHIDTVDLEALDIAWTAAAGCNANSVAEYLVAALLCLSQRHGFRLCDKTIGVVGVGQVGRRVAQKAQGIGMTVLQNDPPRRSIDEDPELIDLADLLPHSDIVTLHTPLTGNCPHATRHLANARLFSQLQPGSIFVNACRGPVTDSDALMHALDYGQVAHAVIDVWENEPLGYLPLVRRVDLCTPHIAGYSFEGRADGTLMVYRAACGFLEVEPTWDWSSYVTAPEPIPVDARGKSDEDVLWEVVQHAYDIEADDRAFRTDLTENQEQLSNHFRKLRVNYPERREFAAFTVELEHAEESVVQKLKALSFNVVT